MNTLAPAETFAFHGREATLAQHLGYSADQRLLILNADDLGLTTAVTYSIAELFGRDLISSTSVMVTGNAFALARDFIRQRGIIDCGLHLAMTSSLPSSPSRPLAAPSQVPSLVDDQGFLLENREQFFLSADHRHAEIEARLQIETALDYGINLTHIDSHEGTLQLQPLFAEVYLRLGRDFRLPVRMGSRRLLEQIRFSPEWLPKARSLGLLFPDNLIYIPMEQFSNYQSKADYCQEIIKHLPPGVTEMYFHPASASHQLEFDGRNPDSDPCPAWSVRAWDYELLTSREFRECLIENSIRQISFAPLRDLMRA